MVSLKQLFLQNLAQTTDFPLAIEFESAEGNYLIEKGGKKHLDLISGISVSNIGHRHPKVVAAIKNQVDKYMHLMVYGEFVQAPQVMLANKLISILPNHLNAVYLVNSGAEAIDGAIKLAKRYTARPEIVSFENAYHGSSHGPLSIMGSEEFKTAYRPLVPGSRVLPYNNFEVISQITTKTAAVVIESVQSEAGYKTPSEGYLKAVQDRCREVGALLILDEIQTGFGRTGHLFGFQHDQIAPDIVTLAKGLGGGMPIGAFVAAKKVMDSFKQNPILGHITTFGGHPVCAAAALANVEVITEEKWYLSAKKKEQRFRELLVHDEIHDVSGRGLMLSVTLKDFETVQQVMHSCIEQGVIIDWFLFNQNALRIAPPLTITLEEINYACQAILNGLNQVSR